MRRLLAPFLAAALLVPGCGNNNDDNDGNASGNGGNNSPAASQPASSLGKPVVDKPVGDPPKQLQVTDIIKGTGDTADPGDMLWVHYVGVAWSTGAQFDASWDRNDLLPFTLGQGDVIAGWDQGMAGMKVGGRRKLVIPPELAYKDEGAGEDIKPGETLIFIVDLVRIGQ